MCQRLRCPQRKLSQLVLEVLEGLELQQTEQMELLDLLAGALYLIPLSAREVVLELAELLAAEGPGLPF